MNMEQSVIGVSNCVIRGVILYLTAQNLNGSNIYPKIVETFGENVIMKPKVFHQIFQLFFDRFRYHLCFEWLKYDATNDTIEHTYHWSLYVHTDITWATFFTTRFIQCGQNTKH